MKARTWGGNFLLNCGPAPDGTMPPGFYERCAELADWMAQSRESLIGAGPSPGDELSSVPITTGDGVWYLHVLPAHQGAVQVHTKARPQQVLLLRTGAAIPYERHGEELTFELPADARTALDDVVAVYWLEDPQL